MRKRLIKKLSVDTDPDCWDHHSGAIGRKAKKDAFRETGKRFRCGKKANSYCLRKMYPAWYAYTKGNLEKYRELSSN